MRLLIRIVLIGLVTLGCLLGTDAVQAQSLPTPSAPILVVNDSTQSDPYQNYVPELLAAEGLNEFQVAQLPQLTASFLGNYNTVVLPHLTLTSAAATLFQNYVNAGGVLVGFRPDTKLATVFGVTSLGTTLAESWISIDTTTTYGSGLVSNVMKFHGTADEYTLGTGTKLATLYQSTTVATTSPAVVTNTFGTGRAVLFAYDLSATVALMRQGNPAWAGYPNTHDGNITMRASQMFMDLPSKQFWNDLGDGALNDVPQADEQMRLFSNAVVLTNAAKLPLPRFWYYPNQQRALLLVTGDHHGDLVSDSTSEESTVHSYGGLFSEFMWDPYNVISNSTVNTFLSSGDALGVHFNDTAETDSTGIGGAKVTWSGMQSLMSTSLIDYATSYPTAPQPVTTRDHFLIWLSNNSTGAADQIAQARLFQSFGIQMDLTYSSFPNRWGYMTGSGLPMKFLDTTGGTVLPVYEQATQYEDDVQLSTDTYSMQWTVAQAQSHYQQSLSDSMGKYNTTIAMLFHPDHWVNYQTYAQTVLQSAETLGVPMSTTANWLSFWLARSNTAVSNPSFSSNVLSFSATGAPAGLTLLVPNTSGTITVSKMTVDGQTQSFATGAYQGVTYASTVLGAGNHAIAVTYAATVGTISGAITPASAAANTTLQLQQGSASSSVIQTMQPAADGTYSFGPLPAGTYIVTPLSLANSFSPTSATVTLAASVTGVNFASVANPNGETLFTTQTPASTGNAGPYELGTVIQSDIAGSITAVRFWKDAAETGTHNAHIWSSTGQLLATVTFVNETASGWQQQNLPTPLQISANTQYVISVNSATTYVASSGGLAAQIVNQDLSSIVGNNGLFSTTVGQFPTSTFGNTNYFRDIVFVPAISISGTILPASISNGTTVTLSGSGSATTQVNSSGVYSFSSVSNGTYAVTPSAPGLLFNPASQVVTVSNSSQAGVNFAALQTESISGTLTSLGSGATVTLSGAASATTTADASGNFIFPGLLGGTYTITPVKASVLFTPASQTVTVSGAPVTANFTAAQTYSISGSISPSSTGSGTLLTLSGAASATVTANASGNYSFTGLQNGSYTVTASKTGNTYVPVSQAVTINNGNATVNFIAMSGASSLAADVNVSKDQGTGATTIASAAFSTNFTNELLLAFISADYTSGTNTTVTGVTGGGLTWALAVRTNTQAGSSEVWRAFSATTLSNITVTATLSQKAASSMTVMSFVGADTTGTSGSGAIGAVGTGNANPGAPSATLTTTRNGSWVFGVGNDWDNATARTPGTTQSVVHQYLTATGDTYWVQKQNSPTLTSGTAVPINDTAPTGDRYNLSIVEILPVNLTTYSITGTVTPLAAGAGATLTLSGPESGSVTADVNGNYTFNGIVSGTYTIVASNPGYIFSPASASVTVSGANATAPAITGTPSFTISGSVTAAGSGATVTLSGPASGITTADVNGNYSFPGLLNGSYTVAPSKSGVVFTPTSLAVTVSGANSANNNFTVAQSYSITGSITPSASGSGATVTLSGAAGQVVTANSSGSYTFTGLANGTYTVTPTKAGFVFTPVNATVTVTGANATVAAFTATPAFVISGSLTPATAGSGATVSLTGTSTAIVTADVNGNYTFLPVVNGTYTVTPTKTGAVFTPASQSVTVNNANMTANFTATGTYSITGVITPAASGTGATVTLAGSKSATTTADVNGNYSFTGLADGTYSVTPTKTNFIFTPANTAVTINGANATANFTATQGFPISGTISPVLGGAGTTVSLSGTATATTITDSNGNYTFVVVQNGAYTVTPTSSAYTFTPAATTVTVAGTGIAGVNFVATSAAPGETLFTTQTPTTANNSDGATANYELGMAFTTDVAGQVTAVRFWKGSSETGVHIGKLWSSTGTLIASVTFANETVSGWQQQAFATPIAITASTTYVVSVNTTNSFYAVTPAGMATQIVNQDLSSIVGTNGVYNVTPGQFPASSFNNNNYFRDVVFAPPGYTVSGTVSPAANGAGTTLILSGGSSGSSVADANGNFTFSTVPNGTYTITPSKSGFVFTPTSKSIAVNNGAVTGVAFTAAPVFTLSGQITPTASGSGTKVTLTGSATATATADANGNYSFPGLLAGSYTVTPTKTSFVFTPPSASVTLTNANATANFAAVQSLTISGSITPAASGSGATVTLSGGASATTTADSNGNYSFSVVNGTYTVTPSKSGFTLTPTSTTVTVNGANATANFTAAGQLFTISGSITPSASGSGATVTLSGGSSATTTADSNGNYSFSVVNGTYTVTPGKSGFSFTPPSATVTVNGANATANFTASGTTSGIAADVNISTDKSTASTTVASSAFSTTSPNELLLAFISADNISGTTSVSGVSGGGLTWTLVQRTNVQSGTAEIWKAFATANLSSVTVTATLSQSVQSSMTVMSFTGVSTTAPVGAAGTANAGSGAPTASLTTTKANSWVIGVGTDWDNAISRTLGANQVLIHQFLSPAGDTYWVQRSTALVPAGTVVTINDTAPTGDRYDLSIVEIVTP